MSKVNGKITIGKITRIRGLKGEVVCSPLTDDPQRFFLLKEVWVSGQKGSKILRIERIKQLKQKVFLKFQGVDSPEAAKPLVNSFLEIEKENLLPLPDDRHYVFDIIGLRVLTTQGKEVGVIKDVVNLPANDVYTVKNGEREYDIPATKEIVKEIDLDKRIMIIEPLEGLLG